MSLFERCRLRWEVVLSLTLLLLRPALSPAEDTNNGLPVVSVATLRNAAEFGSPTGAYIVQRAGDTNQPLVVNYRVGGSASNGWDYQRLSGAVTIPAGQSSASIEVIPVDNQTEDALKEVTVTLVPSTQPFTLVVLPDTQYYTHQIYGGTNDMFMAQTRWVAAHKDELNIAFVLHEGDLTDWNSSADWANARLSMSVLNGVVPYALAVGNHDGLWSSQSQTALFNAFFNLSQFQNLPTFGGVFESNRMDNSYHLFSAGGVDWLVLSLEFGPRDSVLAWANEVVTNHPDCRVIVVTHAHVYYDNTLLGSSPSQDGRPKSSGRMNDGTDVWEEFLRHHANVGFVFCGHIMGTGRLVGIGDHGNQVFQMLANYQFDPLGGAGYLRLVQFFPDQDRMSVRTYSPYLDNWLVGSGNQFAYTNLGVFTNTSPGYLVDTQYAFASLMITNETVDATPPGIVGFGYTGLPPTIKVTFSEPVEVASAESVTNYSLDQGVAFASATLLPDGRTVALVPDANLASGQVYSLTVDHVKDRSLAGNEMTEPVTNIFTYAPILLSDDFADGLLDGWTVVDDGASEAPSLWRERSGHLIQASNINGPGGYSYDHRKGTHVYWNDPAALDWSNCTFSVSFNSQDDDGVGVLFRYQNRSNYYKVELDSSKRFRKLFKLVNGVETTLATEYNGYSVGTNYVLRVEMTNSEFLVLLNGNVLFGRTITDNALQTGTVGLYTWADAGAFFDNLKVTPLRCWPRASIQSPTNGAVFTQPDFIPVVVDASAPDSPVKRIDVFWGSEVVGSSTNSPCSFQWQAAVPGNYTFVARVVDETDEIGISAPVSFAVVPAPESPAITAPPAAQNVRPGEDAVFRCRCAGGQPLHYQWLRDGDPIAGATNALLIVSGVQPGDTGDYSVLVANPWGDTLSQSATLSLDWTPPPVQTNDPPSLLLSGVDLFDPGGFLLSLVLTNLPASQVTIEWSSNFLVWSPLLTLTNGGPLRYFTDPEAINQPYRFYRAVPQP
jgi:hypothetical protein